MCESAGAAGKLGTGRRSVARGRFPEADYGHDEIHAGLIPALNHTSSGITLIHFLLLHSLGRLLLFLFFVPALSFCLLDGFPLLTWRHAHLGAYTSKLTHFSLPAKDILDFMSCKAFTGRVALYLYLCTRAGEAFICVCVYAFKP